MIYIFSILLSFSVASEKTNIVCVHPGSKWVFNTKTKKVYLGEKDDKVQDMYVLETKLFQQTGVDEFHIKAIWDWQEYGVAKYDINIFKINNQIKAKTVMSSTSSSETDTMTYNCTR